MATNSYFSKGSRGEQLLYEDLIIESIKINGYDVYYIPRNIVSRDEILNEDIESLFDSSFMMEVYPETLDSFEGDGGLLSKFGFELRDQARVVIAKRSFLKAVYSHDIKHPREGDLIYFPLTKALFEIMKVADEKPFYQLSNLTTYTVTIEKFEYRGEELDTGITEIDDIQNRHSTVTPISFEMDSPSLLFSDLDVITLVSMDSPSYVVTASVMDIDNDLNVIKLGQHSSTDGIVHILEGDYTLSGSITGATAMGTVINTLENDSFDNDQTADNSEFESFNTDFIDNTENNPFGNI